MSADRRDYFVLHESTGALPARFLAEINSLSFQGKHAGPVVATDGQSVFNADFDRVGNIHFERIVTVKAATDLDAIHKYTAVVLYAVELNLDSFAVEGIWHREVSTDPHSFVVVSDLGPGHRHRYPVSSCWRSIQLIDFLKLPYSVEADFLARFISGRRAPSQNKIQATRQEKSGLFLVDHVN